MDGSFTDRGLDVIPLHVVVSSLVWVIHDYFITLEDEVTYFWSQKLSSGTLIFFWIRYYTIFLLIFDAIQVHTLTTAKIMTRFLVLGAIILWSIQIIVQLRVYNLFNRSRRIAAANGALFVISVGAFLWIMLNHGVTHPKTIGTLPPGLSRGGCQTSTGIGRWALWLPATLFEFVLFGLAVYKTIVSPSAKIKLNGRRSLTTILLCENILYFFVVGCVLVLNNLMAAISLKCTTHVPWFGFGPFHASLGIAMGRMLLHLRKFASDNFEAETRRHVFPHLDPTVELSHDEHIRSSGV